MPTLPVELNADGVHSIRAPNRFTTNRSFSVELENVGRSTHVHLHLDDDLDEVASLAASNHYVEDESVRRVHVAVDGADEPVRGKLKIVTGYGSTVQYVDVVVEPPVERVEESVVVDESLSKPPEREPNPPFLERVGTGVDAAVTNDVAPAVGSGLVVVALALVIGAAVGSLVVLAGVGLVVGATVAALVYVLR